VLIVHPIFFNFFFPCHVLKSGNTTLSGYITSKNVSKELKNFLPLLFKVIMQQHSQLPKEELVGVQDNHDTDVEIADELSDFENLTQHGETHQVQTH
jgi:hypothetical protein